MPISCPVPFPATKKSNFVLIPGSPVVEYLDTTIKFLSIQSIAIIL